MFPFALPRFAPTAVPRVLAFFSGSFRPLLFRHFPFRFRVLSSASAFLPATQPSVSSFPFFPFLPLSGLIGAASPLSLPCFPRSSPAGFPSVLSRFPYSAFCWFPFVLPCFAPAAVPQVIPFWFHPPGPVPDFRFLSSASLPLPATRPSVSSFPFLPGFTSQRFSRCALLLSLLRFPLSLQPDLSCFPSRFPYLAFCWFPFVLSCFAPAAVPQVIPFQIPPPGPMPDFHFLFVRFRFSISLLSLSVLPFHFPSRLRLTAGFPGASVPLTLPRFLPLCPAWFPMPSFRFRVLGFLFVSFRPSQLRSHSCSTGASLSGLPSGAGA